LHTKFNEHIRKLQQKARNNKQSRDPTIISIKNWLTSGRPRNIEENG